MKKALVSSFIGAIFAAAITSPSFGQLTPNSANLTFTSMTEITSVEDVDALLTGKAILIDINSKAQRHFAKDYQNPSDVRWTVFPFGTRVHFNSKGKDTKVYYDTKGNPQASVSYYFAKDLSPEIYRQVRSKYFDYKIFVVTEITADNKTVYLVKLEGRNSWKTIRIAGDEMEVVEDYLKS